MPCTPRGVGVAYNGRRVSGEYLAVPLLDDNHFVAVETGSLDVDGLAREEPANCQRLKPSLCKPSLLPINGDLVGGRYVGKRREGRNPVRIRVEPHREVGGAQVV
jgi:hypothetical protein